MDEEKKLNIEQTMIEQIEYLHDSSGMVKRALGSMGYPDAAACCEALADMSQAIAALHRETRLWKKT